MSLFSSATRAATLAQWGLNAAVLANPYVFNGCGHSSRNCGHYVNGGVHEGT
jgi:hypothetical protein